MRATVDERRAVDDDIGAGIIQTELIEHRHQHLVMHTLAHVLQRDLRAVLRGNEHRVEAQRTSQILGVFHDHLGLAIRAQLRDYAVLAHICQALRKLCRRDIRQRQVFLRLIGGVANHQALVTHIAVVQLLFLFGAEFAGFAPIADVGIEVARPHVVDDASALRVKAAVSVRVANLSSRLTGDLRMVERERSGDFAFERDEAFLDDGFHRDAGIRILGEVGVDDCVGDLVSDLVGMAFGDGFRNEIARHDESFLERCPQRSLDVLPR